MFVSQIVVAAFDLGLLFHWQSVWEEVVVILVSHLKSVSIMLKRNDKYN